MIETPITRRRALSILAAGSAIALGRSRRTPGDRIEWRGTALGADARIVMLDAHRPSAQEAIGDCLAEIERLERSFSLYRSDTELTLLNRAGFLRHPSLDLRRLLQICKTVNLQSNGLFDPTVQPVWRFYAQWFAGRIEREPPPDRQAGTAAVADRHRSRGRRRRCHTAVRLGADHAQWHCPGVHYGPRRRAAARSRLVQRSRRPRGSSCAGWTPGWFAVHRSRSRHRANSAFGQYGDRNLVGRDPRLLDGAGTGAYSPPPQRRHARALVERDRAASVGHDSRRPLHRAVSRR